jgi:hypothetical protein
MSTAGSRGVSTASGVWRFEALGASGGVHGEAFSAVGSPDRSNRLYGALKRDLSYLVIRSSNREVSGVAKESGRIEWSFGRKRGLEI